MADEAEAVPSEDLDRPEVDPAQAERNRKANEYFANLPDDAPASPEEPVFKNMFKNPDDGSSDTDQGGA